MKVSLFVLVFLFSITFVKAQTHTADSLLRVLNNYTGRDTIRVNILNQLAFEQHFHFALKAVSYGLEAKALAKDLGFSKGEAFADRYIGLAFWAQASHATALEYFLKGLYLADSLRLLQLQADLNGNIGLVYNGLGNYEKALRYFNASIVQQRLLKNRKREIVMLNNKGDCYSLMKKYDSALLFYGQSLSLGEPIDYLVETNKRNIGNVLESMGKWDEALKLYSEAKLLSDRYNDFCEISQVKKSMASVYLKKNQLGEAEQNARDALTIAMKGNNRSILRDCYDLLYKISLQKGQLEGALENYKSFILYRDSIQNLAEASRVASLQLDFELRQKQAELDMIKKINDEEIKRKNLIILFSVLVISLMILLFVMVFRNYRMQKSLNRELMLRNEEINRQREALSKQHEEVLILNEEIQSQQEEAIMQRDVLAERNEKIETLHARLLEINQNLERVVVERTTVLQKQNKKLEEYAFINAHKLRAPVASVMGLINILELKHLEDERGEILQHLKKSSWELDQVIRSIGNTIHQGISALDEQKSKDDQ